MVDAVVVQLPSGLLDFTRRQFRLDLQQQADKQHRLAQQLILEYREILYADAPSMTGAFKILCEPSTAGDNYKGQLLKQSTRLGFTFHLQSTLTWPSN